MSSSEGTNSSDEEDVLNEFSVFSRRSIKRRREDNSESEQEEKLSSVDRRYGGLAFQVANEENADSTVIDVDMEHVEDHESEDDDEEEEDERPSFGGFGGMNVIANEFMNRRNESDQSTSESQTPKPVIQSPEDDLRSISFSKSKPKQDHVPKHTAMRYGIGAKLLSKMGYVHGKGLGAEGKGIVEPIQQKLRPTLLGLGGVDEKLDKDNDKSRRKKNEPVMNESSKPQTRLPKRKPKDVYKTIKEMEQEGLTIPSGFKHIIDMTGGEGKVIDDLSELRSMSATPVEGTVLSAYDKARKELEQFSTEWRNLQSRKEYAQFEINELNSQMDDLIQNTATLEQILAETKKMADQSSVDMLAQGLDLLQGEFVEEIQNLKLDEVAIALILPVYQSQLLTWNPLEDPTFFRDWFVQRKTLLRISSSDNEVEHKKRKATMFESLIHQTWLPKVQSTLTNEWNVHQPSAVILLLEEWDNIAPGFIRHILLVQVILPRIKSAIDKWQPTDMPLHTWLFPWFSYWDSNIKEEMITQVQAKFASLLQKWRPASPYSPIDELNKWRELTGNEELEKLLLAHLIPTLGDYLRRNFVVDPSNQNLEPVEHVIKWAEILRPSVVGVIFEDQFFPKWLHVLHQWLTDADANLQEISSWYEAWSDWFPNNVKQIPAVNHGFIQGLDLINSALDLDSTSRHQLAPPKKTSIPSKPSSKAKVKKVVQETPGDGNRNTPTFREVVEHYCSQHDLFLLALGKSHPKLGLALYKITADVTGKGGVTCYLEEDVLWIKVKGLEDYEPISLDKLIGMV